MWACAGPSSPRLARPHTHIHTNHNTHARTGAQVVGVLMAVNKQEADSEHDIFFEDCYTEVGRRGGAALQQGSHAPCVLPAACALVCGMVCTPMRVACRAVTPCVPVPAQTDIEQHATLTARATCPCAAACAAARHKGHGPVCARAGADGGRARTGVRAGECHERGPVLYCR